MINWWNGLHVVQQILAVFAIPATVVLVIQTLLLLFGLGSGHDASEGEGGQDGIDSHEELDYGSTTGHEAVLEMHGDEGTFDQDGTASDAAGHHEAAETHDTGLRIFTVRGLVAFFAIGGWVGIALIDVGLHPALASLLSLLAGLGALVLIAVIFRLSLGLQSSGNLDLNNAIGLIGDVYLRIPPNNQGTGKVTIVLQGRSIEIDALTEETEGIGTGGQVLVTARRGDRLVVKRLH
jgi:hypothetical protein